MKELVIEIHESEYAFITKLLQQFRFVRIKENNNFTSTSLVKEATSAYLFSPTEFDDLYDKVMDENVTKAEILAEFETHKVQK